MRFRSLCLLLPFLTTFGCASQSDRSFTLPPGDAARGQEAFLHFRCYDCHQIEGVEMPVSEESNQVIVELGGKVDRLRSYEELVTGIINPSHRLAQGYSKELVSHDGKSRMTVYNDVMTVSQLADLATFLQGHYKLRPFEPTHYPDFYYMP